MSSASSGLNGVRSGASEWRFVSRGDSDRKKVTTHGLLTFNFRVYTALKARRLRYLR